MIKKEMPLPEKYLLIFKRNQILQWSSFIISAIFACMAIFFLIQGNDFLFAVLIPITAFTISLGFIAREAAKESLKGHYQTSNKNSAF